VLSHLLLAGVRKQHQSLPRLLSSSIFCLTVIG
jgi:hypothetical protein